MTLEDNVAGRKAAEELLEWYRAALEEGPEGAWREAFTRRMWEEFAVPTLEPPPTRPTMTMKEALSFENKRISYGKWESTKYSNIPTDYLVWLYEQSESLGAYLRSKLG